MFKKCMEIVRIFVFKPGKIVETNSIHQNLPTYYYRLKTHLFKKVFVKRAGGGVSQKMTMTTV